MKAELKRICELQPSYSESNTPEMQERGAILRGPLKVASVVAIGAFRANVVFLEPIQSPLLAQNRISGRA